MLRCHAYNNVLYPSKLSTVLIASSFAVGGTAPIKSASFGCFSDDCDGAQGGAAYVFVTGDEIDESDRRSRYRDAKNTGWVAYEKDDNGDTVRDDDGNAVKQYTHGNK
jgi:hypothetical protein